MNNTVKLIFDFERISYSQFCHIYKNAKYGLTLSYTKDDFTHCEKCGAFWAVQLKVEKFKPSRFSCVACHEPRPLVGDQKDASVLEYLSVDVFGVKNSSIGALKEIAEDLFSIIPDLEREIIHAAEIGTAVLEKKQAIKESVFYCGGCGKYKSNDIKIKSNNGSNPCCISCFEKMKANSARNEVARINLSKRTSKNYRKGKCYLPPEYLLARKPHEHD